jgi:hypothetical protein
VLEVNLVVDRRPEEFGQGSVTECACAVGMDDANGNSKKSTAVAAIKATAVQCRSVAFIVCSVNLLMSDSSRSGIVFSHLHAFFFFCFNFPPFFLLPNELENV